MIIVRLKGGLGNQMFQYALGLALSQMHDTELVLDRETYLARDPRRIYALADFNIEERFATSEELTLGLPIIEEKSPRFDPTVFDCPKDCIIDGYWQSEAYFRTVRRMVRQHFTLKSPSATLLAICDYIENSPEPVFVQVRRGDYVDATIQRLMPAKYYLSGTAYIDKRISHTNYFIFSDDIRWCKTNLRISEDDTFLDGSSAAESLYLMSLCRHGVMSASSFAWWGAWLGRNDDRIIIAPEPWYQPDTLDGCDIVPDRWVKMTDEVFDHPVLSASEKRQTLIQIGRQYGLRIFIETGTLAGDTVDAVRHDFGEVHSIELSQSLYERAKSRINGATNVHLHYGNSAEVLPEILKEIHRPALFWLDAHHSGGETAGADIESPLQKELATIFNMSPDSVILIDDARSLDVAWIELLAMEAGKVFELKDDIIRLRPAL